MKYTVVPKHTLHYVIRQLAPVIKDLEVTGFARVFLCVLLLLWWGFFVLSGLFGWGGIVFSSCSPHPAGLVFHPGSLALSSPATSLMCLTLH